MFGFNSKPKEETYEQRRERIRKSWADGTFEIKYERIKKDIDNSYAVAITDMMGNTGDSLINCIVSPAVLKLAYDNQEMTKKLEKLEKEVEELKALVLNKNKNNLEIER